MKPPGLILIFAVLVSFAACEPPVTFTEPQPAGAAQLDKFPKRIQGSFRSLSDNSVVSIRGNSICRIYDLDVKLHMSQLDSGAVLSGDTLIQGSERAAVRREGDSLVYHFYSKDTLFVINEENVLTKFRGYYFLNTLHGKDSWAVKKLGLSEGKLSIGTISMKEDIATLKEITESPQDTAPYKFAVSKSQFRKFVKADGFSNTEVFVKE